MPTFIACHASSLDAGECLGAPMSYSTGGQRGPNPTERWIDLDHGKQVTTDGLLAAVRWSKP